MSKRFLCALALSILFLPTFIGTGLTADKKSSKTLEILCAPAMRNAIEEMLGQFEKKTNIVPQISYDGSGALLSQLRLSPYGDLFMPADKFYTDEAIKLRLVQEPKVYAYLVPVIMVQKGNKFKVRTLIDLTNKKIRVGLVDERTAAIGKTSAAVLKKNHISAGQLNLVYKASKVDELANAIKLRSVDAVIIWKPVAIMYPKEADIIDIPSVRNVVVPVSAGIIKASKNKATAKKFLNFLTSKAGKAILAKYHYPTTDPSKK